MRVVSLIRGSFYLKTKFRLDRRRVTKKWKLHILYMQKSVWCAFLKLLIFSLKMKHSYSRWDLKFHAISHPFFLFWSAIGSDCFKLLRVFYDMLSFNNVLKWSEGEAYVQEHFKSDNARFDRVFKVLSWKHY